MAIKAIYPNNSEQKKRNKASGRAKAKPVRAKETTKRAQVKAVKKSAVPVRAKVKPKAKKRSIKRKSAGFLGNLFASGRKSGDIDYTFLLLVGVLVAFGLIMLLSASTPTADVKFGKSYYFFIRQFAYVAVGMVMMLVLSHIDYRKYKPYARIFMIICMVLLAAVFLPGIGVSHNGSRRWINLGVTEIQPSEFTKLAVSMFFAAMIEDRKYDIQKFSGLLKYAAWIGVVALLMMFETHLSGTIVLCGIAVCIMLVGGASFKLICGGGAGAFAAVLLFLQFDPVRMARVTSFLHPFADKQGTGYQTLQSLYAIGSGGIFGKGLGESVQKFSYLPEPYNDFIFAVVCEELGLVGAAFIICLFIGLIIRGIKISMEAPDVFGSLMVVGIMAQVAIQTILNIAVATSSMPNTGVSLPFFSYGGTAVMILLAEMGIVLSVSRYSSKNT
ncbi:MAG: putative lipid II flippase FtsW [Clostridia bacterium]|nr:putative lipid II flippase FtsW [Clostridia bacterium]